MSHTEFQDLHSNCVTALGEYVAAATRTGQMLAECSAEPPTPTERLNLVSQEIVENDAHMIYLGIKRLLYAAALLGYGLSN